ncbi:MAG: trypsin-like serine protease [Verrucomicrobia bacterium]|jgi:serine protease Do|nr:trypsin-like serine protease [Verrucomicrobiota bacterium]
MMNRKTLSALILAGICALSPQVQLHADHHESHIDEQSDILSWAERLNTAFIQVADNVSPSVVVIEVAHPVKTGNALMDMEHQPFLDQLPEEERRKFEKYFNDQKQAPQEEPKEPEEPEVTPRDRFDGKGSGMILSKDGQVLTNYHVIEGASRIRVRLQNGRTFKAMVKGFDPQSDVAVIQLVEAPDSMLMPIKIGDSDAVKVGEFAIAIGAPFELAYSVTYGHVSAKGRSSVTRQLNLDHDFIQTDADINPGNSGGPLVNIRGEAIGINTMIRGLNTGIGFAIPINMALEISDQIIETGTFKRALLGIGIQTLTDNYDLNDMVSTVSKGVIVSSVMADSAAGESNLKPADIIIAVGGKPVASAQQLKNQVRSKSIGKPLVLDVVRNNDRLQIEVKPREWIRPQVANITANEPKETPSKPIGFKLRKADEMGAKQFGVQLTEGLMIWEVAKGSLAENWLSPGEIITDVNYQPVRSPLDFAEIYRDTDLRKEGLVVIVQDAQGNSRFVILKERDL